MPATLSTHPHPYFDRSEIIPELELTRKPYNLLKPLRKGDMLPCFGYQKDSSKWQQFFNGVQIHGPVLISELLNKPLVMAFNSQHWRHHGLELLKQLNAIRNDVLSNNGNLLVIGSEKNQGLEHIAWNNNLSLSFYLDTKYEIAEKLRIYSQEDPIWNKVSGINSNVPLLATYVISPSGQIVYDHVDLDFSEPFPARNIVAEVQQSAALKSINRLH